MSAQSDEILYPFPRSRVVLETVQDFGPTLQWRVGWQRSKGVMPLLGETAVRAGAQVTLGGETYALPLLSGCRKRRQWIVLAGERVVGRHQVPFVYELHIYGRRDRLTWEWRIGPGKTRAAIAQQGDVVLRLPLALGAGGGGTCVLQTPDASCGAVFLRGGVAFTVFADCPSDAGEFRADASEFRADAGGVILTLPMATLHRRNVLARWETWFEPAASEADARSLLLRHAVSRADRAQRRSVPTALDSLTDAATKALLSPTAADKRGPDRLILRADPQSPALHDAVATATAAHALYQRYRCTGDDAEKRRAYLLARGAGEFQLLEEESTHRGAFWERLHGKKQFGDPNGERTLTVRATGALVGALHQAHGYFQQEMMQRAACTGAQWLLLKMNAAGCYAGARYLQDGPPIEMPDDSSENPDWAMAFAMEPLVETFRRTSNPTSAYAATSEVFLKAAMRIVKTLQEKMHDTLPPHTASVAQLAAAIEGTLSVSRESERADLVVLAKRLGLALRARRAPDGVFFHADDFCLSATLAACGAALALARVDDDPIWPLLAIRALRAIHIRVLANSTTPTPAENAQLLLLPSELLLTLAARAPGGVADRTTLRLTRDWQVFEPDAGTRDYIRVHAPDDAALDYLALVCPFNLQVLIVALAAPHIAEVEIRKNGRLPYVKNLLTGDYDQTARLLPLGTGDEAAFGVFLADT